MTAEQPAGPPTWHDVLWRWAGTVVAVWGAVILALAGAFLTPFRVGSVLVPVSLLLAVGGNAVLTWFAHRTTGRRFLAVLPGLVWVVLAFVASDRTTEGDIVLYQQNWVSTGYLLAGSATIGVAAYRVYQLGPTRTKPHDREAGAPPAPARPV